MRALFLLALVGSASAGDSNTGVAVLNDLISNLSTEITDLTNAYQETKNRVEQNIQGATERRDSFAEQESNAEAEQEGFEAKAATAQKEMDEEQAKITTFKNDINALGRVMKVTESQTLEQIQEIDNGLAAVALAKEKVGEMGGVPASLLQTLKPKIDLDDFESLYNAKKGKKLGLLAKGGAAFTSSKDVLMNELQKLEDEMVENKKEVQKDHKSYKNKRNEMKGTKTVQMQQSQKRFDTLKADKAAYTQKAGNAENRKLDMNKQKTSRNDFIAERTQFLKEETAIFKEASESRSKQKKLYQEVLTGMGSE